jgi:hypothetical protein
MLADSCKIRIQKKYCIFFEAIIVVKKNMKAGYFTMHKTCNTWGYFYDQTCLAYRWAEKMRNLN